MQKSVQLGIAFLVIFFFGSANYVFSQETRNDDVKVFDIEIYSVDDIPVRLNNVKAEVRLERYGEFQLSRITCKYTLTNLTNIKIGTIQMVELVFDQNGKRISTDEGQLIVDLEPFETKEISVSDTTNPINPEHRRIIAINSVLNVGEVWDLSVREIERAVTAFVKGKYAEPLKVRHTKLPSP